MKKTQAEIPIWAKNGLRIWVEVRDKSDQEVLEYLEAVISTVDQEKKILSVKILSTEEEKQIRPDLIHERIENHKIINDLSDIPILNDAELLKHLEIRYRNNLIHCFCGPTLIVINPYKSIPREASQETKDIILQKLAAKNLKTADPHIWTISAISYDYLYSMNFNQAICISGESGAGKTECTKKCLEFITNLKGERKSLGYVPIEAKIMSCNPLLESFGNSKTFRNDNSSRFGKYTVLYIDKIKKSVRGASIENYLLEKSRICSLAKEERNYHIFYAMTRFMDKEKQAKYQLINKDGKCDPKYFNYLNQSSIYEHPKINDQEFYDDVCNSFQDLEFTNLQTDAIWKILATVLYIGNLQIDDSTYVEGKTPAQIKKTEVWERIIKLTECNPIALEEGLTMKEMKIPGGGSNKIAIAPSRVKNNIDTIAKEFYTRTFNWIVKKLNIVLLPKVIDPAFGTIGVLDIFGFEIFEKNSIEQLFINYANERLQSLYIDYIFKNECRIFEEEGLGAFTKNIIYKDNKPLVMSLDNPKIPPGIFDLVDQMCVLSKTDEDLYSGIKQNHGKSTLITFPKFERGLSFLVRHTARDVEYVADGFVEKNKDELSPFLKFGVETGNAEVVAIFNETSGLVIQKSDVEEKVNPKEKFLGFKFRRNMNELINQLSACYCHFVRCIKPNELKKSDFWVATLALMQIKYMGLLDSLKVRKMSYPFRFEYKRFFEIFQDLDMGEAGAKSFLSLEASNADFMTLSKELLKNCSVAFKEEDLLYGKTRIFINEKYKIELEKALLVKQTRKKECLQIIKKVHESYKKKTALGNYFQTTSRGITLSRDLVKSWTAKLEGMKFKIFLKINRRVQAKFKSLVFRRNKRLKLHHSDFILKFFGMIKMEKSIRMVLHFKRSLAIAQAMLDRQIVDSKNRYCRSIVNRIIENAWKNVTKKMIDDSISNIQSAYRGFRNRQLKSREFELLTTKITESRVQNASIQIQKIVRGYLVRTKMERLHKSASRIQGFFKMIWMKTYYKNLKKSSAMILTAYKKHYLRKKQMDEGMKTFMKKNGQYNKNVQQLEHDILFSDQSAVNMQNIQDFVQMPFYIGNKNLDFGKNNFHNFIPKSPDIELNPKIKLISLLVDIDVRVDSTNIYFNTFSNDFNEYLKKQHQKANRLISLELGESFAMGINDEKEVSSWGLNDYAQCARTTSGDIFALSPSVVKNLTVNPAKMLSLGNDHGMMVDEFNNIYVWGRNSEGQLGLGHTRPSKSIHVHTFKDGIRSIIARDNQNYIVTEEGKIFSWPNHSANLHESTFRPNEILISRDIKIQSVSAGSDFAIFLTATGLLYSMGDNQYGQLGIDSRENQRSPVLIKSLKEGNQKVIEISCGFKHAICRTSLTRVYTWGSNFEGQLGLNDLVNRHIPTQVNIEIKNLRVKVRSVQAGLASCSILLDDRQLFYTGNCGFSGHKTVKNLTRFFYEQKFFVDRMVDDFTPLKLVTKWSKILGATYIVFADFRNCSDSKQLREKFAEKINSKWTEYDKQILPPQDEILMKSIGYKYLQKDLKNQKPNLSFSTISLKTSDEDKQKIDINKMDLAERGDLKTNVSDKKAFHFDSNIFDETVEKIQPEIKNEKLTQSLIKNPFDMKKESTENDKINDFESFKQNNEVNKMVHSLLIRDQKINSRKKKNHKI